MKKKIFSVPFNGDPKLVDFIIENKRHVYEVYFGLPHSVLPSGRVIDFNFSSSVYMKNLFSSLERFRSSQIDCCLLVNKACEGSETFSEKTAKKYREIISLFAAKGLIQSVVLSNPYYIAALKKAFPSLRFSISVNSRINSVYRAQYAKKMGFDTIIIDRDINHNKKLIKDIKSKTNAKIKMLVNECCINECIFRDHHFNLISHHEEGIDYKSRVPCVSIYSKEPWRLLKSSFILPRDIRKYEGYADIFKLAERNLPTKILRYLLESYFTKRKDGDLLSILSSYGLFTWKNGFVKRKDKIPYFEMKKIPANFRETVDRCNSDCENCGYCRKVWESCLRTY